MHEARPRWDGTRLAGAGGLMRYAIRTAGLATAVTMITLTAGTAPAAGHRSGLMRPAPRAGTPDSEHVIEIMLENHTYTNLLAVGARPADGKIRTIPAPPTRATCRAASTTAGRRNCGRCTTASGKGYRMDRYNHPPYGASAVTTFGARFDPDLQYLAHSYESATSNFQPAIAPTRPNVMMALNATAHDWYYNRRDPQPGAVVLDLRRAHPVRAIAGRSTSGVPTWLHPRSVLVPARPAAAPRGRDHGQPVLHRPGRRAPAALLLRPARVRVQRGTAGGHLRGRRLARPAGPGGRAQPLLEFHGGLPDLRRGRRVLGSGAAAADERVRHPHADGDRQPVGAAGRLHPARTTNVSILSFMQHLWDMAPLNALNAQQNDLAGRVRLPAAAAAPAQAPGGPVRHDRLPRCEPRLGGADRAPDITGCGSTSTPKPPGCPCPRGCPARCRCRCRRRKA